MGSGEIQVQIDPIHGDLDQEISGLHRKITQLKGVFYLCPCLPRAFFSIYFENFLFLRLLGSFIWFCTLSHFLVINLFRF